MYWLTRKTLVWAWYYATMANNTSKYRLRKQVTNGRQRDVVEGILLPNADDILELGFPTINAIAIRLILRIALRYPNF